MTAYIVRRLLYAIPILIGVNLFTFVLFFFVNTPDDMARAHLGVKRVSDEQIARWKQERDYHLPYFYNKKEGISFYERFAETIFWKKSVKFLLFQFGRSDDGRNIGDEISTRVGPSLAITVPSFVIGILVNITAAMILAFFRATYLDFWGVVLAVIMMSISVLFYVIGGQWMLGKVLRLVPVSGFDTGLYAVKFVVLPVVIGVVGGIGTGVRLYRTFFLEEIGKDYIRTARAKGLPESLVLFKHALKNALIPILTGVVVTIPFLIMGSLILESFFAIPGMGSFTLEAIQRQDFAIVQAMVFLGSAVYVVGLLLTDISYTLVDPRIRFS